ncbi:MAG: TIGR00730 family Rossman fold protein, partial [Candidatus Omnitrophota bacterium]|nr:TIGR00730 family Rossman fold protein [Candidatus Omnitrophota bacterium]
MRGRSTPRRYTTHNTAIDAQIASLVSAFGDGGLDRRLLEEMVVSVYRLGQDGSSTGDLKILNAAVKELRYAFKIFRPYRGVRKVAMFGSARLSRQHPACYLAREFGRAMVRAGWMVITGAASGIMKAGHEGAGREASFGLNIRLPFEQEANPIIAQDAKLISCKYFFTRKLLFIKESHATALFPGGFGTLDEGFESLTLVQTGKSDPRPIIFVDESRGRFWTPLLRFFDRQLVRGGMISPSDRSLYQVVSSAAEAVQKILDFYAVYQSLRYVDDWLVLRLQRPLPDGAPEQLTHEFHDLLRSGTIRQGRALPGEADEPELQHLPRLLLRFNRMEYGRLAELIHRINV